MLFEAGPETSLLCRGVWGMGIRGRLPIARRANRRGGNAMAYPMAAKFHITPSSPDSSEVELFRERLAFMALASVKGIGQKTLESVAQSGARFTNILAIDDTTEVIERLRGFGARIDGSVGAEWQRVREQAIERGSRLLDSFKRNNTSIIFRYEDRFPKALFDLPNPPHWLFVKGNLDTLNKPAVTVVGTRDPSEDGRFLGRYVGACFSVWGVPTVSGLAMGIDQQVHKLSLRAKVPTLAVLGTGILSEYPKGAVSLREAIVDNGGALVTEHLPTETYSAENFVRRNRLQAALGRMLVPVEWNQRSGTAHTVRFATMLRRPIACLRLADWEVDRVVLAKGMGQETGRIFTIPGDEAQFRNFVQEGLATAVLPRKPQSSLFAEDGSSKGA